MTLKANFRKWSQWIVFFYNSKDRIITLETTNHITSLDTLSNLPIVDYDIVDDMKKVCVNIKLATREKIHVGHIIYGYWYFF